MIDHALARGLGHRDGQGDGFVELSPPGFHRNNGRNGDAIAKQLGRELRRNRVRLKLIK